METNAPGPDGQSTFDVIGVITQNSFVAVEPTTGCHEAAQRLLAASPQVGDVILVTDPVGSFLGLTTLRDCLTFTPTVQVSEIMRADSPSATLKWTAEGAAHKIVEEAIVALPVLDEKRAVIGVVMPLVAHRYLLRKMEEDSNDFAGIIGQQDSAYINLSILADFRRRIPWVLGLAVAGLAAGYVVHVYEHALDALVILALYMPMVADTGGNVGTQSASLVTRAISFGDVRARDAGRILWREARVAVLLAASLFLFAYLKVLLISNASDVPSGLTLNGIGLAIAIALAAQVISSTLIGAALPIAAVVARQDPAVVSGPALTTIVDFTGLILYFSITTYLLGINL